MKARKRLSLLWPVVGAGLLLSSCTGSSDNPDPKVYGMGPASLAKATVFWDADGDYALDPGELYTQTGADGSYSFTATAEQAANMKLVLMVDEDTVWSDTGISPSARFTMVSVKGKPGVISIMTTLLAEQSGVDEAALKTKFGVTENASLLSGYAKDGEIDNLVRNADKLYGDLYSAAASKIGTTRAQALATTTQFIIDNASLVTAHVDEIVAGNPLPPSNEAPSTTSAVGDEIFHNIPIDAGTMSFGVGMDEISRKVVSGSYCLNVPEIQAVPKLALSQNTRDYRFTLVKSEKDLRELLNVGGRLDLGTQVVEGSLEGRFINQFRSDSSAVYAMVKAEYVLSGYKLYGVSLADNYLVSDSTKASYVSNYKAFRAACGDRYLDQVATGGAYYGLLKITTDSSDAQKDLTVSLEGKYGKAGISVKVSGDLKSSVAESLKNTNVSITVGSRGVSPEFLGLAKAEDQLIDNLDDFFGAADQFITAISNPANECNNDTVAFKKCAYTASFADYATISGGKPRFYKQVDNLNFVTKLMGQYEDYNILDSYISNILVQRSDYDWTGYTTTGVAAKKTYLSRGKTAMEAAFRKCTTDFDGCTGSTTAANLQSFDEILWDLPYELWREPKDCKDLQRINGKSDLNNADVSLGGDALKPFKVSCRKMSSSQPETYLDIYNTSGSTDTLSYNMARNVNPDGSTVSTAYKKLRVNVNFNDLEIINNQADLRDNASTAAVDSPTKELNFPQAALGQAVDCFKTSDMAKTNIDLTGTAFHLAPAITYKVDTHPLTRYEWVSTVMTWDEADAFAKSKGGHLVVLDDTVEFNMLRQTLDQNSITNHNWIGLKRTDLTQPLQYQQFQWVTAPNANLTSKEQADYFYSGEPNNWGNNEDCAHFWYGFSFKLNDILCTNKFPFFIEYELAEPSGQATISTDRKSVNASVNGTVEGQCVEVRPATEAIRLVYDN